MSVLGGAKPTIPQNIRGTLTLNNLGSVYILIYPIILYKSCAMATLEPSEPFLWKKIIYIIAFAPNLQRASFYSVIMSLPYSTTVKLLLRYNTYMVLSEPQRLTMMLGSYYQPYICYGAQNYTRSLPWLVLLIKVLTNSSQCKTTTSGKYSQDEI